MINLFDIKDKVILITGGLGFLGRNYVEYFLDQGVKIIIFDLPGIVYQDFQNENCLVIAVDIASEESIKNGLSLINLKKFGFPNVLINNAAIDFPPGDENSSLETYPEKEWDQVMNVNLKGTFLCSRLIGSEMVKANGGTIINIGSIYGEVSPDQRIYSEDFKKPISYAVSKGAIPNMTRYLSTYWPGKVRVNTLTLGGVFNFQDSNFLMKYSAKVPMGRMAIPKDYLGALHFLTSDASAYMTGANLIIDGGYLAW